MSTAQTLDDLRYFADHATSEQDLFVEALRVYAQSLISSGFTLPAPLPGNASGDSLPGLVG